MKKNISISFYFALLLVLAIGCKSKKMATTTVVKNTSTSPLAKIIAAQLTFNSFSTKAKTNLKIDGNEFDLSLNIRIKDKETIWVSATAYGLVEVGRVLITPDSIKILDKIRSQITLKPFSFIHKYTSSKIDYAALQAILVGNPMPFVLLPQTKVTNDSSGIILNGLVDNLTYQTRYNPLLNVISALLSNINASQKLEIKYDQFTTVSGLVLPLQVTLNSTVNNKSLFINMLYSVPQINTVLEFPFNIPQRYVVIN